MAEGEAVEQQYLDLPEFHEHPLALHQAEAHTDTKCIWCKNYNVKEGTVWVYQCTKIEECDFFVHKPCVEFLSSFRHFRGHHDMNHPFIQCEITDEEEEEEEEFLSLSNSTTINGNRCPYCSKSINKGDVVYGCRDCKYFMHKSCVDSSFDKIQQINDNEGKEILEHPLHPHPLLLSEIFPDPDAYTPCCVCYSRVEGCVYGCSSCEFYYMHKACAELPFKPIQHPFHPHLLLPVRRFSSNCPVCDSSVGPGLGCLTCGFYLHINCIGSSQELPILKVEHKGHPFFFVKNRLPASFCIICGVDDYRDDVIFKCMYPSCKDYFHVHCASSAFDVPKSVKLHGHWDPLTLSTEPFVPDGPEEIHYCDICQCERNVRGRVYRCIEPECGSDFTSHIGCALSEVWPSLVSPTKTQLDASADYYELERKTQSMRKQVSDIQKREESVSYHLDWLTKQFNRAEGVYTRYVMEISRRKDQLEDDHDEKQQQHLPQQRQQCIRHPLHPPHHLSLRPDKPTDYNKCGWCKNMTESWLYQCEEDGFKLCVECASSSAVAPSIKLRHPNHLFFHVDKLDYLRGLFCIKCRQDFSGNDHSKLLAFVCVVPECNFAFHIHCLLNYELPGKINNGRHPDHDLIYTNPENVVINPKEEYYCDDFDCEQQRDPNYPFYYCQQCDFAAHISCCITNEILPSLIEEYENDLLLERGVSLDAFLHHFEEKYKTTRLAREGGKTELERVKKEVRAMEEELAQLENQLLADTSSASSKINS